MFVLPAPGITTSLLHSKAKVSSSCKYFSLILTFAVGAGSMRFLTGNGSR